MQQEIEEAQALGPNTSEEQRARLAQEIEHLKMEMERRRRKKQQEEEEKLQEEMEDVAYMPEEQAEGDDEDDEQLEGEAPKIVPPPAAPKGMRGAPQRFADSGIRSLLLLKCVFRCLA